jgi:hypothetical protein
VDQGQRDDRRQRDRGLGVIRDRDETGDVISERDGAGGDRAGEAGHE